MGDAGIFAATSGITNNASFSMHALFPGGSGDYCLDSSDVYTATTSAMSGRFWLHYFRKQCRHRMHRRTIQNQYIIEGIQSRRYSFWMHSLLSVPFLLQIFADLQHDKVVVVVNKLCGAVLGDQTVSVTIKLNTWMVRQRLQ